MCCKKKTEIEQGSQKIYIKDKIAFSNVFLLILMPFIDFAELGAVLLGQVKFHLQGLVSFIPI